MKRKLLFFMFIAAGIISGCSEDGYRLDNSMRLINEPVFMTKKEFRSQEIKTRSAQQIKERGKMCFYAGYIYISEPGRGIHIIDNRDPHKPKSTGFVELDGNTDIAAILISLYGIINYTLIHISTCYGLIFPILNARNILTVLKMFLNLPFRLLITIMALIPTSVIRKLI